MSKAFDTVNHQILINKLKYFGITDIYLEWFRNYLNNRKQFITYDNNKISSLQNVSCGVPQGSILGSLLFLLYVNYLYKASSILKPIMFAEDTNLFYSNIKQLFHVMNQELLNIQTWFNANKLSLQKRNTVFFTP